MLWGKGWSGTLVEALRFSSCLGVASPPSTLTHTHTHAHTHTLEDGAVSFPFL